MMDWASSFLLIEVVITAHVTNRCGAGVLIVWMINDLDNPLWNNQRFTQGFHILTQALII